MENNNGKGIFYGVIGVATLVVAIIGATFAFFSATASNVGNVAGTAASANLSMSVTQVSNATGVMVPQLDAALTNAMKGTGGNTCKDGNGSTVCKVYKIVVTNVSTAAIKVSGTIALAVSGGSSAFANLKINKTTIGTTSATEVGDNGTFATATPGTLGGTSKNAIGTNGAIDLANTAAFVTVPANGTYSTYFVVWISETGTSQNSTDKGSFTGTVSFNSASGSGVTSTFTS